MTNNEALILPEEIEFVPVEEIPEQARRQLTFEAGDVAITRLRSRTPTRIISADLADLLREFSTAMTVPEAILMHSVKQALDPRELLENAYPFIKQMVGDQLLVPATRPANSAPDAWQRGRRIGGYEIVSVVQTLLDTQLLQVRDAAGRTLALKVARPEANPLIGRVLEHEAAVLAYLHAPFTPEIIEQGRHDGQPFVAMSWLRGVRVDAAAAELRERGDAHSPSALLDLCTAVAAAYADLHRRGVIHGDIHPGNILVSERGAPYLLDFGLSRVMDESAGLPEPFRGGVPFFSEPEYCAALLAGERAPRVSAAGEQYGLAALLYHLFTGANYLDFSLEEETLHRQIAAEAPLPFSHHSVAPWPDVETVLRRALSKEAEDRYPTVADFAAALGAAAEAEPRQAGIDLHVVNGDAGSRLVSAVLQRLTWDGELFARGLPRGPLASVKYGAAGVAYFLYRAACTRSDPYLLALSDAWALRAEQLAGDEAPGAFSNEEIGVTPEVVGRISPFHSPSGLAIVRYLLGQAMGDKAAQGAALQAFVQQAAQACDGLDVTLGRSGVLLHSAFLQSTLADPTWAGESGLADLGAASLAGLWAELDEYGPIGRSSELTNLGAAHGWAGMLYATLCWCEVSGTALPAGLEERLQQLAACGEFSGRGRQWPWDLERPGHFMSGWCNGSAGLVFLWSAAHRALNDSRYLDLAEQAAWNAWEGPGDVVSLCCGLAGRGYALLNMYRASGDSAWLRRAGDLARRAALQAQDEQTADFEGFANSLYKGDLGVAALLVDLERPLQASMPFFEPYARI